MTKLFGFRGMAIGAGACLILASAGCGAASEQGDLEEAAPDEQGGAAENIGEAAQPLIYFQDGFKVSWTYVGHPFDARKIAACGRDRIFALNYDFRLYYNESSGANDGWIYSGYPSAAREIGCDGVLFAMNYDKNLYVNDAPGGRILNPWKWVGKPFEAAHIASGGGNLFALNTNKSIYTSDAYSIPYNEGADSSWAFRNTAPDAERVTGATGGLFLAGDRSFALNVNKSLWYNDKLLVNSSGANWHPFPNGGLSFVEISAGAPTVLYGLTTTYDLWKAVITEDNCTDGIDNDSNGFKDANESECASKIAAPYCATHPNGNFCFSRFSDNTGSLAKCSGGQLIGVDSDDFCILVGGGQDHLAHSTPPT